MNFIKKYCLFAALTAIIALAVFAYLGKPLTGIDDANIFSPMQKIFIAVTGLYITAAVKK